MKLSALTLLLFIGTANAVDPSSLCGTGTVYDGSECVSTDSICGENTKWDDASKTCVSASSPEGHSSSSDGSSSSGSTTTAAPASSSESSTSTTTTSAAPKNCGHGWKDLQPFSVVNAFLADCHHPNIKVVLEPADCFGWSADNSDGLQVTSDGTNVHFQTSEKSGSYTIKLKMTHGALKTLRASGSSVVEVKPGFNVDDLSVSLSNSAKAFSSSICAKTFTNLQVSNSAQLSLSVPSDCGAATVTNIQASNSGEIAIKSEGELTLIKGTASNSAKNSIEGSSGTANVLTASNSASFNVKGLKVENVQGSNDAHFGVSGGDVNEQKLSDSASVGNDFQSAAQGLSAGSLGQPDFRCRLFR